MILVKIGVVVILLPCAVFFARFAFRGMHYVSASFSRQAWRQLAQDVIMTALSIAAVAVLCGVMVWVVGLP